MEPLTNDGFVSYLRNALHYLYDPVHLRRNILVKLLGLDHEFDPATALQQLLTAAIHRLKPAEDESPQSNAWRIYDTLNLQYIRQYSRSMVATQLGVSERQLRREQRLALEALTQTIIRHHNIVLRDSPEISAAEPASEEDLTADDALIAELSWLKNPEFEQRSSLEEALETVNSLVQPLSQQWHAPIQIEIQTGVEDFQVAQLVIRNILLTILSVVIPLSGQRPIRITSSRQGAVIEIRVACDYSTHSRQPFSDKDNASIDTARRLASINGALLAITQTEAGLMVNILLPADPDRVPVLVIDDNADWLDLLKRYAVGSRYQVIGLREPESARRLAEKLQPAVIFLDVMMPNIDGWQIISELRQERATRQIPVIVCSILPLEGLALSLGVNAFLQKPITQSQFLAALDQQIGSNRSFSPTSI